MKMRQGFVSNSSSSSFVVIGYKITQEEYNDCRALDIAKNMLVRKDRDHLYLGEIIASIDRDGIPVNEREEIEWEVIKKITDEGQKRGLGKPKLFRFIIEC